MSHEQALATAVNIVRCTTAASLTDDDMPDGLSAAQQGQFKERALAGADCSALDSPYSIYDLAYYAASGSDSGAKIIFSGLAAHQFDDEGSMFDASLIEHFNQATVAFLHEAAEMGDSNALMSLAAIYEDGNQTPKDLARAHAYAAVITRVTGGKGQLYEQLLSKKLSPQQRADSARWQEAIFKQYGARMEQQAATDREAPRRHMTADARALLSAPPQALHTKRTTAGNSVWLRDYA